MSTEIGSRIRRIRVNQDLSQQDIAEQLGITPGAYAKIERGETDPQASRLVELAKILKVDVSAFLKDKPDPAVAPGASRAEMDLLYKHLDGLGQQLGAVMAELKDIKKAVSITSSKKK